MSANTESTSGMLDNLKIGLAIIVLVAGIGAYYYFPDTSQLLRAAGIILSLVLAIIITLQTETGRGLWQFIQGSRGELRQVVWPTRDETLRFTLLVIVFVIIMALFFWGLDWVLFWITGILTGKGS